MSTSFYTQFFFHPPGISAYGGDCFCRMHFATPKNNAYNKKKVHNDADDEPESVKQELKTERSAFEMKR